MATGRVYRKPARAQVRMQAIERNLRQALADVDRRYWADVARAAEDAQDATLALTVRYPDLAGVGKAYGDALAASWEDAGAWTLWALSKRGKGLLLGATVTAGNREQGTGNRERTAAARIIAQSHSRSDREVLANAARVQTPEEKAVGLILEGEEMVIPRDAIDRYVADHMPQLRTVLDERRRETCRDIIARASGEGMDVRRTAALLQADGFGASAFHRETIARTEAAHLYSSGSVARYRASGAVSGLRYEAVMDDRTTEECAALHGHVFRADDVDGVTPPIHFNCRSELQPVLFDEVPETFSTAAGFLGDTSTANPMQGFGALDITGMPAARNLQDLYRPLQADETAEMRELWSAIMEEGRRRWGAQWAA
jgi:SPP1 gp7 family putative phage head morphogenesis protein